MASENRIIKIINHLVLNDVVTEKELEKSIQSSSQTLKKDIEELNEAIKGVAKVHFDERQYSLEIINQSKFQRVLDGGFKQYLDFNSSHKRVAFIIHYLIRNTTYVKIDDLSEAMSISRSTLNNDIKKAKKKLSKYTIKIKGVPNKGIRMIGSEFNFRLALLYLVYDYYYEEFMLPNKVIKAIDELADYFQLNYQNKNMLYKSVAIAISRVKVDRTLNEKIALYQNYEKKDKKLNSFFHMLENKFESTLSENERDFISFPINTHNTSSSKKGNSTEYEKEVHYVFEQMIQKVEESYFIKINKATFFENIKNHLMILINRLVFHFPLNDVFSDKIQLQFPLAFELAKVSVEVFKENYQLQVDETEISYLAVYFALFLEEAKKIEEKDTKKIAIISNTGRGTYELVKRQLLQVLDIETEIHHYNEIDYEKKDFSYYDFLVTLIPLVAKDDIPIIRVNSIFDREYIAKEVEKVLLKDKQMTLLEMDEYIEFSYFKLLGNYNYRSNVTFMIEQLVEDDVLDLNFFKRWEARENIQPMIYDNGIAIPHAVNKGSSKFVLSIGIYEKAKPNELKIIFLLGIPEILTENQQQTLAFIYDKVFSFGNNTKIHEEFLNADSEMELKSIILKG